MDATLLAPDLASYLTVLDWPEVLACLAEGAQSDRGRAACLDLPLCATVALARARSDEISELVAIHRSQRRWPALGVTEIEPLLDAAEQGVALGAEELSRLADFCETVGGIRRFFVGDGVLDRRAQAMGSYEALVRKGRETFDGTGDIRDSASPDLARLRRERDRTAERARRQVESLIDAKEFAPFLQDRYVTLRSDRFVLPVKASFKSMGLGIVHDTSRTGETVFLEPTAVVETNNQLKVIELSIRRECRRILEELAALVADQSTSLRRDLQVVTQLDVLTAMARLAVDCDAVPVELTGAPEIRVRQLRHPLLALRAVREKITVVANDLELVAGASDKAHVLVISGPNAGGKTVLLKSIGLAAVFARAGMHLPVAPGSRIGFFSAVLADIGDQQSVLGDLSTFSAHLANLSRILATVDEANTAPALVLCDELMAGTNPDQGAALARAILEHLADRQCLVVTTTHYDALKALADGDRRFRNAGMEYDLAALRPTYHLRDGQPGRSYALDIATIMGLPGSILYRARDLVGQASLGLEEVLREMQEREAALAQQETELAHIRADLEARSDREKEATLALVAREREMGLKMREAVEASVRETRTALREIVRRAREEAAQRGADAAVACAHTQLQDVSRVATAGLPEGRSDLDVEKLKEALAHRALGVKGQTRSATVKPSGAARSSRPPPRNVAPPGDPNLDPLRTRGNTVDVRGQRADEALSAVEKFLDQATLSGADAVFVIHGHGTGALRGAVREYLAVAPHVARFRAATPNEGGDGVTVAVLRD